jgi:putative Flp pilus-assembly TadE/G-like protein
VPVLRNRPHGEPEQGAVSAMFALLLSQLVIIGMLAMVVDLGQLWAEREELQNGADAAAHSVALDCAHDNECAMDTLTAIAAAAANVNAKDGSAQTAVRCIRSDTANEDCDLPFTNLTRCTGEPPDTDFVEIRTRTLTADGQTLFPPAFGTALLGASYQGGQTAACARVAWGGLVTAPSAFSLAISECAFTNATRPNPGFTPYEQVKAGTPDPAFEAQIEDFTEGCGDPGDPLDAGDLAWLDPPGGDCFQRYELDATVPGRELDATMTEPLCHHGDLTAGLGAFFDDFRKPVVLPVFDQSQTSREIGPGHNYRISGFAYFLPSGYRFGPATGRPSIFPPHRDCEPPCLQGFFTQAAITGTVLRPGVPGDRPDHGLRGIQLVG